MDGARMGPGRPELTSSRNPNHLLTGINLIWLEVMMVAKVRCHREWYRGGPEDLTDDLILWSLERRHAIGESCPP